MNAPTVSFYEVNLSNCDGLNATLHVYSDGQVFRVAGTPYAVRKLLEFFHEPDAPPWVAETLARHYPKSFRAV